MPATTPTVYQAWAAVMAEVKAVAKSDRNREQGFDFRGIDSVINAVGPALREHKVFTIPRILSCELGEVLVGKNRTPMGRTVVEVEFTIYGPTGDSFVGSAAGEAMDSGDKATTKAQTVAWRVFLIEALALPTGDRDPDHDAYERARNEVDWDAALAQVETQEQARELWRLAKNVGAPKAFLDQVTAKGATLGQVKADETKADEGAAT